MLNIFKLCTWRELISILYKELKTIKYQMYHTILRFMDHMMYEIGHGNREFSKNRMYMAGK